MCSFIASYQPSYWDSLRNYSVPLINFPSQTLIQSQACICCGRKFPEASLETVAFTWDFSVDLVPILYLKQNSCSYFAENRSVKKAIKNLAGLMHGVCLAKEKCFGKWVLLAIEFVFLTIKWSWKSNFIYFRSTFPIHYWG